MKRKVTTMRNCYVRRTIFIIFLSLVSSIALAQVNAIGADGGADGPLCGSYTVIYDAFGASSSIMPNSNGESISGDLGVDISGQEDSNVTVEMLLPSVLTGGGYVAPISFPGSGPGSGVRIETGGFFNPNVTNTFNLGAGGTCNLRLGYTFTIPTTIGHVVFFGEVTIIVNDTVTATAYITANSSGDGCISTCENNIVANGTFSEGLVAGPMPTGKIDHWTHAYTDFMSPDVSANVGCNDSGFVSMWGNQVVGEAIQETLATPIQSGKTYRVTICYKWNPDPNKKNYIRFLLRASNAPLAGRTGGTVIGRTPDTYLSTWTTVTLPDWTADQNYTMLTIGPENNSNADAGDSTSYGAVDNVCIQLISDTTVTYRGLRHQSIGSAQLAALGDTELVISNMTSTGFNGDGVRVLLPEGVESWYGLANDVDPGGLLPDSAVIHRTSYATVNGFPNSLTGATYAMKLDSNKWEIGIDNSSIGATSYTLEIYNDDTLVHRQPISGAGTTHKLKDGKRWVWIPVVVGIVVVSCTDYHHKTQYDKNGHVTGTETEWSWDCPGIIGSIIPSGGSDTTEGDKIIILSDTYPGIVIQSPSYEEIHFGGIPSVRITEGTHSAEFQGITHTNIGNATLTKWNDSLLTITNVEENDGLLIEVDSSVLWDCDIALDKSPVELPPGATIQTIMRGSYPDDSEGELARMNVVNSGSEFNLSVDFAAIGSPTQSYWIYNGETLVGSGNGVVSPLLQCIDWPDDLHIRFKDWSFKFTWEESTQVVDQAGTKQATMIEISPSIAPTMQHLTEISMIGSGVDSFAITRENGVFVTTLTSTYTAGWQLISVPLEVNDYSKLTLFPTANSNAFRYEGAYYITDTLENGVGYWLKFPTTTSVSMTGIPITVDTIDVDAGWNIIGCISEPVAVSDIVSIPGGIVTSQFYGFDHGYLRQDTIMPNKGNWVKVSTSGKLVLSGSSPSSAMNTIKVVPISELPPSPPDGEVTSVPREFKLEQNYPNPFNPRTVFSLQLPVSCYVTLKVFNILGEEVATVIDGFQVSGFKSQVWEASGVASGVYYYQLKAKKGEHGERFMDVKKMLIIR